MTKKNLVTICLGVLLVCAAVTGGVGWYNEHRLTVELQSQIKELERQEKRSAIDRSISSQMERIAYQQKEISDEQREEAIEQTRIANEMRAQSEIERQNAVNAERNAVASEKKAVEASVVAENQRKMAEHQRVQAEFSKRVADTLSYIALGRSLGSLSTLQYQAGNSDISDILTYASYIYTSRYGGDVYKPDVLQALMQSSQSKISWAAHIGCVSSIALMPKGDNRLVSVSTYGEISQHERKGNQLQSNTLFSDKSYDFRDVYVDPSSSNIYAVSRTGHLAIVTSKGVEMLYLEQVSHPIALSSMDNGKSLLVVGECDLAVLDIASNRITRNRHLDYNICSVSRLGDSPLLFDDNGGSHLVKTIEDIKSGKVPVKGKITAFASSGKTGLDAYGTSDGTLYIIDKQGKVRQLIGHKSRISKIKIDGMLVYSSSYDGTLNLWKTNDTKIEPIQLFAEDTWIMNFTFDNSKNYVWTGNQNGRITSALISVPMMVERVKGKLKRDLTADEWAYYIGGVIPYESFTGRQK